MRALPYDRDFQTKAWQWNSSSSLQESFSSFFLDPRLRIPRLIFFFMSWSPDIFLTFDLWNYEEQIFGERYSRSDNDYPRYPQKITTWELKTICISSLFSTASLFFILINCSMMELGLEISHPLKKQITSPFTVFFKHGQLDFCKASHHISDYLTGKLLDFLMAGRNGS